MFRSLDTGIHDLDCGFAEARATATAGSRGLADDIALHEPSAQTMSHDLGLFRDHRSQRSRRARAFTRRAEPSSDQPPRRGARATPTP